MEVHIDGVLLVWNFVAFVIMVIFMKYVLWPKIYGFIVARQEKIDTMIKDYNARNQEVEGLVSKMKEETERAAERRRHLLEDTKKESQRVREELVDKAANEAQQIVERAKLEINHERTQAMEEARRDIGRLITRAVKVILFDVVDEKLDNRIIEETEKAVGVIDK